MKSAIRDLVTLSSMIVLLGGLFFGIANSRDKFEVGDCVKGSTYYYKIFRSDRFSYDLKMINITLYLTYRKQVVNKAFKRIKCNEVPITANMSK